MRAAATRRDAFGGRVSAFRDVLAARLSRRDWLRGAGALSLFAALPTCAAGVRATAPALVCASAYEASASAVATSVTSTRAIPARSAAAIGSTF